MAVDHPYNPLNSKIGADALADFLRGAVEPRLQSVPGVGPKAAEHMATAGVTTTHQLLGKFLSFKGADTDVQAHCDAMWLWLNEIGVNSHRAGIVKSIAEKLNIYMPGLYDESRLAADDDDDDDEE